MSKFTTQWLNARLARNKVREPQGIEPDEGPESKLHEAIIAHCESKGWVYFHGSMATRTHRTMGEPDFTIAGVYSGKEGTCSAAVWFIECKRKGGKLSPAQNAMKHHLESLGHKYFVVRSFEEFLEVVK